MRLFLIIVFIFPVVPHAADEQVSPLDIQFTRQAVRRLVFDESDAIPLSSLKPAEVVSFDIEHPLIEIAGLTSIYKLAGGLLEVSAGEKSESARWVGGFNPFATYDVCFEGSEGEAAKAGVEFATPDNKNRISILAGFESGKCTSIYWDVQVDGIDMQERTVELEQPVEGPFTLRVQVLGSGLNIFVVQNEVSRVVYTRDFSKMIDLRSKEHIRSFEYRLLTMLDAGESVIISEVRSALTTGAGQADICAITYEDGAPLLDQGRLWFTMSVRGRRLPHPLQGVFSLNPSVFDIRFEGIIVFDRDDGLLRNEIASHIFYDREAGEWRGLTVGFSASGDPVKNIPKQLWAVSSARDPRFGFSIMKARSVTMPGATEDPHIIYDSEVRKWRVLVCSEGKVGFPAALYESDNWNGPFRKIAGPAEVNGTGCLLQKFGDKFYALFGSADRKFYVYSYPDLKPLGALNISRPPWDNESNTRCWPNVIPLPDGYPAPYIALTMDRANYPGLNGWTYGALYLYHGHP
ncbi:MAG: hypothetical protein AB3N63_17715 [Puniceicoccaceae bacterium]